jgi:hypothetical protein
MYSIVFIFIIIIIIIIIKGPLEECGREECVKEIGAVTTSCLKRKL